MSDFVPDVGEVRDSLVYLNKNHAKQYGDVDLLVVGSETAAQFDRMIVEVERKAAERALTDLASKIECTSKRTDNTFTEHAVVEAGGLELLREAAEAYRREGKE